VKLLICADSFGAATDHRFSGMHFTDHLTQQCADVELINLSIHGASNALIQMQLYQGLSLNPDAVILSFTDAHRMEVSLAEYPELTTQQPEFICNAAPGGQQQPWQELPINHWNRHRWFTNCWLHDPKKSDKFRDMTMRLYDQDAIVLKNIFAVRACLDLLQVKSVPFCYSLGGIESAASYTKLLTENYMDTDVFADYGTHETPTNLWHHQDHGDAAPQFHVSDQAVAAQFASECLEILHDQKHN